MKSISPDVRKLLEGPCVIPCIYISRSFLPQTIVRSSFQHSCNLNVNTMEKTICIWISMNVCLYAMCTQPQEYVRFFFFFWQDCVSFRHNVPVGNSFPDLSGNWIVCFFSSRGQKYNATLLVQNSTLLKFGKINKQCLDKYW